MYLSIAASGPETMYRNIARLIAEPTFCVPPIYLYIAFAKGVPACGSLSMAPRTPVGRGCNRSYYEPHTALFRPRGGPIFLSSGGSERGKPARTAGKAALYSRNTESSSGSSSLGIDRVRASGSSESLARSEARLRCAFGASAIVAHSLLPLAIFFFSIFRNASGAQTYTSALA